MLGSQSEFVLPCLFSQTFAKELRMGLRRISAVSSWWDDAARVLNLLVSCGYSAPASFDAIAAVGRGFETVTEGHVLMRPPSPPASPLVKLSILLFYYCLFAARGLFERIFIVALPLVICWCIAIVLLNVLKAYQSAAWYDRFLKVSASTPMPHLSAW